jgi:stalled ribosome alternative rescue factor ArfA
MKKEIITFKVRKPKPRAHQALFDDDLPFKHRVQKPKNLYQRKPKYRNGMWDDEDI